MEGLGKAETTLKLTKKLLLRLASKVELNDPTQVNLTIARFKKFDPHTNRDSNQNVTNAYKNKLIFAYKTYVEYFNVPNWKHTIL